MFFKVLISQSFCLRNNPCIKLIILTTDLHELKLILLIVKLVRVLVGDNYNKGAVDNCFFFRIEHMHICNKITYGHPYEL